MKHSLNTSSNDNNMSFAKPTHDFHLENSTQLPFSASELKFKKYTVRNDTCSQNSE